MQRREAYYSTKDVADMKQKGRPHVGALRICPLCSKREVRILTVNIRTAGRMKNGKVKRKWEPFVYFCQYCGWKFRIYETASDACGTKAFGEAVCPNPICGAKGFIRSLYAKVVSRPDGAEIPSGGGPYRLEKCGFVSAKCENLVVTLGTIIDHKNEIRASLGLSPLPYPV